MRPFDNKVYICQQDLTDELNTKYYDRVKPSAPLNTVFDPRPTYTHRQIYPALHAFNHANTPIQDTGNYSNHTTFNPASKAPYSGYAHAVDAESSLKNIFMARQKYCTQTKYIPSSNSNMYQWSIHTHNPVEMTHRLLFKKEKFSPFDANPCGLGNDRFFNHTRQQLKDMNRNQL